MRDVIRWGRWVQNKKKRTKDCRHYSRTNDQDLGGVIDTTPVENLPPELLIKDKIWSVPTISRISSGFGKRDGSFHKGIDISNGHSGYTPIYAMADGLVIHAGPRNPKGFTQAIYINHGNGLSKLFMTFELQILVETTHQR